MYGTSTPLDIQFPDVIIYSSHTQAYEETAFTAPTKTNPRFPRFSEGPG